jgi:hypothetical protein
MKKLFVRLTSASFVTVMLLVALASPAFAATNVPKAPPPATYSTPLNTFFNTPALTSSGNPGWAFFTDFSGVASAFTNSNGSTFTSQAVWSFGTQGTCTYYVYVPNGNATANVGYGIFTPGFAGIGESRVAVVGINQNSVIGFVLLGTFSGVNQVQVSNNNGETGTDIGVGRANSLKVVC